MNTKNLYLLTNGISGHLARSIKHPDLYIGAVLDDKTGMLSHQGLFQRVSDQFFIISKKTAGIAVASSLVAIAIAVPVTKKIKKHLEKKGEIADLEAPR